VGRRRKRTTVGDTLFAEGLRWASLATEQDFVSLQFYLQQLAKSQQKDLQLFRGAGLGNEEPEKESPQVPESPKSPAESRQLPESAPAGALSETRAAILWLLEPLYEALETITFVYPDLRAELTPILTRFRERAESIMQEWFPPPSPLEEEAEPTESAEVTDIEAQ
jgi:hypothetical protein